MQDPKVHADIIEAAFNRYEHVAGTRLGSSIKRWRMDRIERKRSTVYRFTDPLTGLRLYYKVFQDVRSAPETPDSLGNRLARAQTLSDKLVDMTSGTAISAARVLAVNAERRTIVTLGVEGREIRRMTPRALIKGRRMASSHAKLVGEACAHIERCSEDLPVRFDWDRFHRQVDSRLGRSKIAQHEADQLRTLVMNSATELLAEGNSIYVHGDLSPTNVLISNKGISLIDFSWFTGFKGYDVGLFIYRLRSREGLSTNRYAGRRQSVMTGYQEAAGTWYHPSSMRFVNLLFLVRALGSQPQRLRDVAHDHLRRHGADRIMNEAKFDWWWDHPA